jgi:hypothetical protein
MPGKVVCPPEKIVNPKTGKCVNVDGKIGKQIIKQTSILIVPRAHKTPKTHKTANKPCPIDMIINPPTGKCVKIAGKIGKQILKLMIQ